MVLETDIGETVRIITLADKMAGYRLFDYSDCGNGNGNLGFFTVAGEKRYGNGSQDSHYDSDYYRLDQRKPPGSSFAFQ